MSNIHVDQKTIIELLSAKTADFLIPDYQRPYAWDEEQCLTLWDDICTFAFPNNNKDEFKESEYYFLGSIVAYKNANGQSEIIDGQQRITTLMLILRAFYDKFEHTPDENSQLTRGRIEQCIWKTNTFGKPDISTLKIDSQVATDNDKKEFLDLLRTGQVNQASKSQYVNNYLFFQRKIDSFLAEFPVNFPYLPARILGNCILLPIEAESQDTALRIFSTLNDRGLPLSDADIFKAQFYTFYDTLGQKDEFIREWKKLEEITSRIFSASKGAAPMDELFTRYMYFLRAKEGNKSTTTEALRKFFERKKYQYLKNPDTIGELKALALFWQSVYNQDQERFSEDVLKKLFVLNYAPNGMWQNIMSVYFLQNREPDGALDKKKLVNFLNKITGFIFTYALTNPGVNALRTPVYDEMVNIVNGKKVSFSNKLSESQARLSFENFSFTNQRPITRSMITWYAYTFEAQKLLSTNENLHMEHIYPAKRQETEAGLQNEDNLDSLGNKVLLENSINIEASDYRFEDKKRIYSGEQRRGKNKEPSQIAEIAELCGYDEFGEQQIIARNKAIIDKFFHFLRSENLIAGSSPFDESLL